MEFCYRNRTTENSNTPIMTYKEIRKSLGVTQEVMAQLLETSRSTISLVELNLRTLPTHSSVLLKEIQEKQKRGVRTELLQSDQELIARSMESPKRKLEIQRMRHELWSQKCKRKLTYLTSKLRDTEKAILLLSGFRSEESTSNLYRMGLEISRHTLILRDLPYFSEQVEKYRTKLLWLEMRLNGVRLRPGS